MPQKAQEKKLPPSEKQSITLKIFKDTLNKLKQEIGIPRKSEYKGLALYDYSITVERIENVLTALSEQYNEEAILTSEMVKDLVDILKRRGEQFLGSPLDYTRNPTQKTNTYCLAIAQLIEDITGICRYQLLIPTLKRLKSELTSESLMEPHVQLRHFVLSDDGKTPIDVYASLDYYMKDGKLKHTTQIEEGYPELSESEADRVINHSEYTQKLYEASKNLYYAKESATSSYAHRFIALKRALKQGGEKKQASAKNRRKTSTHYQPVLQKIHKSTLPALNEPVFDYTYAVESSYQGIVTLLDWFWLLDEKKQDELLSVGTNYDSTDNYTIDSVFQNLLKLKTHRAWSTTKPPKLLDFNCVNNFREFLLYKEQIYYVVHENTCPRLPILKFDNQHQDIRNLLASDNNNELNKIKKQQAPCLVVYNGSWYYYNPKRQIDALCYLQKEKSFEHLLSKDKKTIRYKQLPRKIKEIVKPDFRIAKLQTVKNSEKFKQIVGDVSDKPKTLSTRQILSLSKLLHLKHIHRQDDPCVEQAGRDLKEIINKNPQLYDTDNDNPQSGVAFLTSTRQCALQNLFKAFKDGAYKVLPPKKENGFNPNAEIEKRIVTGLRTSEEVSDFLYRYVIPYNTSNFSYTYLPRNLLDGINLENLFRQRGNIFKERLLSHYTAEITSLDQLLASYVYKSNFPGMNAFLRFCLSSEDLVKILTYPGLEFEDKIHWIKEIKLNQHRRWIEGVSLLNLPEDILNWLVKNQYIDLSSHLQNPSILFNLFKLIDETTQHQLLKQYPELIKNILKQCTIYVDPFFEVIKLQSLPAQVDYYCSLIKEHYGHSHKFLKRLVQYNSKLSESLYKQLSPLPIQSMDDLTFSLTLFASHAEDIFAKNARQISELVIDGNLLLSLLQRTPQSIHRHVVVFFRAQLTNLINQPDNFVSFCRVLEEKAAVEVLPDFPLSTYLQTPSHFARCLKPATEGLFVEAVLGNLATMLGSFNDIIFLLNQVQKIQHRSILINQLLANNQIIPHLDSAVNFLKICMALPQHDSLTSVLNTAKKADRANETHIFETCIPSHQVLTATLRLCPESSQYIIIEQVALNKLITNKSQFEAVEELITNNDAYILFYKRLTPYMAKINAIHREVKFLEDGATEITDLVRKLEEDEQKQLEEILMVDEVTNSASEPTPVASPPSTPKSPRFFQEKLGSGSSVQQEFRPI